MESTIESQPSLQSCTGFAHHPSDFEAEVDHLCSLEDEEAEPQQTTAFDSLDIGPLFDHEPVLSLDYLIAQGHALLDPMATLFGGQLAPAGSTSHGSLLNNLASVTPWQIEDPRDSAAKVEEMLGSSQELRGSKASGALRQFLKHACLACIFHGWQTPDLLDNAIQDAVSCFNTIMQYHSQWTLTAMNNVLYLMDLYGHRNLAQEILKLIGDAVASHWGSDNYITETVQFMTKIGDPGEEKPKHDLPMLRRIRDSQEQTVGPDSPLTLTAQYNLAWATLEEGLQVDDDAQRQEMLGQARVLLEGMMELCDTVLGEHQIQSIHCISTLARVYLMSGQFTGAEYLIIKDLKPRVETSFAQTHPFFWEFRFREAVFTFKFAQLNVRPERSQEYWQRGEDLLVEVLSWRVQNLGPSNPCTTRSVAVLRHWLTTAQHKSELFESFFERYQLQLQS